MAASTEVMMGPNSSLLFSSRMEGRDISHRDATNGDKRKKAYTCRNLGQSWA